MRNLIKDLLNSKLSRRGFIAGMVAAGYSASAANSALQSVAPLVPGVVAPASFTRSVTGTGGELMVEQLIEAGARYMFVANASGLGAMCDALVTRPQIQLIQATQEGQAVSMADGYARASGKIGFAMYSKIGLPHSSSNMYNAMKDRTPLVLFSDHVSTTTEGTDSQEDLDDFLEPVKQYTKWRWVVHEPSRIPEWIRKACKVSTVLPGGPTHVRIPGNLMRRKATATIFSEEAFHIPMELRPDRKEVETAARVLLEASSPVLYVGHEVGLTNARPALVELSELLAMPVVQGKSFTADFPNFHPLFVGELLPTRYPKQIDCLVNFGARFRPRESRRIARIPSVIHATIDPKMAGRNTPLRAALVGDLNQAARDLIVAVKSMTSASQLKARTETRRAECAAYSARLREARITSARRSDGEPVPWPRLMVELNDLVEPDAVIVSELGTDVRVWSFFPFDDDAKLKIGRTTGMALGWGVGASAGVQLALPNRQVVSIQGDGGFLFGQTDSLWTMSRYDIPVLTVILNNQTYEASRWRIMGRRGASGKAHRDYISYLGDPDVDFTKLAAAYNIPGEVVYNTAQLRPAIQRGLRVIRDGRPFLLDVRTKTTGIGAKVSWYPDFSLAEQRKRGI
ncbi:MAG: thiamine pyrophosphate-binding protein [Acidobacteria bacterium]|nr:thiamine pyrophosphate-binding protein [Acidobacteriota bacterium]MCZ6490307.1 thiamine pyrophosphate-binding protein [Acidobacteriota bacterium]MCZ6752966.1 thiamine pyrophosphate-binding protein [Acidobacteriota bacterium]